MIGYNSTSDYENVKNETASQTRCQKTSCLLITKKFQRKQEYFDGNEERTNLIGI